MLLTPPTVTETETCSQWVINFIDELPPYPFGTITAQDFSYYYKQDRSSNVYIARFWGDDLTDVGGEGASPEYLQGTTTVPDLSVTGRVWNMDYPYSWYHPVFEFGKPFQTDTNPYIQSTPPGQLSTAIYTHTYTTTPAISYFSDSDVLLLAANPSDINPDHSTLILDGTDAINQTVDVTLDNYKYPFLTAVTRINSDGTATLMARNVTTQITFESVNMDITPNSGYVDTEILVWNVGGDYSKKWTEESATSPTSVGHIVGDLLPTARYSVKVNGAFIGNFLANGSGEIMFDYTGGYSLKTFEVGSPVAIGGQVPSEGYPGDVTNLDVKADFTGKVSLNWTDPTDIDLKEIVIGETLLNSHTDTFIINKGIQSAVMTNRIVGSEYEYLVKARDTDGLESPGVSSQITIPSQGEVIGPGEDPLEDGAGIILPDGVYIGDSIKSKDSTTVYFVDTDKRRHTFPNEPTYFSYFPSFAGIKTLPLSTLAQIAIGKNVTVRPGTWLVKIQTDPKVYAVEPFGSLRYVSSVDIAINLYGTDWATRILDISPVFFVDYQVDDPLTTLAHPTEAVIRYQNSASIYFFDQGKKRLIPPDVFANNKFQAKFILANFDQAIIYPNGEAVAKQKMEEIIAIR
jgi:hypothetical protein